MLSMRKRVILAKLESTYGTDSTPAAADAILCSNLQLSPLEGSDVKRDFIRPFFGNPGSIRVENYAKLTFDHELAGSGAAGTAPEFSSLLKAANFSETITAAAITGTAQTGSTTSTIKLAAAASAVDDFYTGMSITITGGTGSGQTREVIGYVGSTKVCTPATNWVTTPDATSLYSLGANVIYTPNSAFGTASNSSVTIYFNIDGTRHVLLGARGNFKLDVSVKQIPKMSWEFTGLLGTISDVALPSADFTGWQTPVTVSTANTTDINLLGYTGAVFEKLMVDIGNSIVYRQLVGAESVLITDRNIAADFTIEAVSVATKDWWTSAKNSATGAFCIKHGQTAGNIVGLTAPKVQIATPNYSDSDGVAMFSGKLNMTPSAAAGNDELRICFK